MILDPQSRTPYSSEYYNKLYTRKDWKIIRDKTTSKAVPVLN